MVLTLNKINHALLTVLLVAAVLFVCLVTYVKLVDTYLRYQDHASRGFRDAPINTALQDQAAPFIVNMPDKYANLALKCVGGDLVISTTRPASPVVAVKAGACEPGAAEKIGIPRVQHPGAR